MWVGERRAVRFSFTCFLDSVLVACWPPALSPSLLIRLTGLSQSQEPLAYTQPLSPPLPLLSNPNLRTVDINLTSLLHCSTIYGDVILGDAVKFYAEGGEGGEDEDRRHMVAAKCSSLLSFLYRGPCKKSNWGKADSLVNPGTGCC
jgi:hypothetical protein